MCMRSQVYITFWAVYTSECMLTESDLMSPQGYKPVFTYIVVPTREMDFKLSFFWMESPHKDSKTKYECVLR